jgi:hypothetical protein
VAVVAIAVFAVAFVSRQAQPGPTATPAPSRPTQGSPTAQGGPAAPTRVAEAPAGGAALPPRDPAASPYPAVAAFGVAAGTTTISPFGMTAVRLTLDLPMGWARIGEGMLVKGGGRGPTGVSLSAWKAEGVEVFPCRWSSRAFADRDMTTLDGVAGALASWWGQDPARLPYWNSPIAPLATRPVTTAFLGLPAWRLEVLIPSTLDLAACDGGQVVLWESGDGNARVGLDTGELHRLWVVGLGGGPIVVDASSFPATPQADLDELQAALDSLEGAP